MKKLLVIFIGLLILFVGLVSPAISADSLTGKRVCLDPGHGGSEPGAVYDDGLIYLEEADINLDIAYGLKSLLEANGAEVIMTRYGDLAKSNNDRYTFCNSQQATILVSIHTNSSTDSSMDGSLALYFHGDDKALATVIYRVMYSSLKETAPDSTNFTDFGLSRFASGVLLKSKMPAAMTEPVFMSNPSEAQLLLTPLYLDNGTTPNLACENLSCRRGQIAKALYAGIEGYFANPPSDGGNGGGGKPCPFPPCKK